MRSFRLLRMLMALTDYENSGAAEGDRKYRLLVPAAGQVG
jgi:hypothetical protein